MRLFVVRCCLPFAAMLIVQGCGPSGPKRVEVSGVVKYNGKEVEDGDILFQHEDKTAGPEGGKIVNGKYTLMAREGKNRVEVRATRKVPGKKGPMGEDWIEQYIPTQYNEATTLTADVKSSGNTAVNFEMVPVKK